MEHVLFSGARHQRAVAMAPYAVSADILVVAIERHRLRYGAAEASDRLARWS